MIPSGGETKNPRAEHGRQPECRARLQLSGGDGPEPLGGMLPVLLDITNVVYEIDRCAHQTERDEGQRGPFENGWLKQAPGRQRRR